MIWNKNGKTMKMKTTLPNLEVAMEVQHDNTMQCKIDWKKVFYFSFITETNNHKKRRVISLSKLRKCIIKEVKELN